MHQLLQVFKPSQLHHSLIFFSVRTTVLTILRQVFPKLVFVATILSHSQLALFIILLFNVFKVVFFFSFGLAAWHVGS